MRSFLLSGLGSVALLATCLGIRSPAVAQDAYPSRVVKIVVPAAGGSTTDTLARVVADKLRQKWGKSAIVENVAGGAMNIGASTVARAAPDGYTLLVAPPSPLSINDHLFKELGYSPAQFVPITLLATIPNVLVVRNELPVNSIKELISYGKTNPGKLSFASQGAGSTAHLTANQLEVMAGLKMVHVPYRGAQPALTDVIAGHVDMFFDTPTTSGPLYRENKLKMLGVADSKRLKAAPEVPTISEAGLPGFRSITWFGLVAPPQTPDALAERLNHDVVEILNSKEVKDRLQGLFLDIAASSRADTSKFFADDSALWGKVIKEAKIPLQ